MIPFNIEKWNTGKYDLCTRSGSPVKFVALAEDVDPDNQRLITVRDGYLQTCWDDGRAFLDRAESSIDVMMVPKMVTHQIEGTAILDRDGNLLGFQSDDPPEMFPKGLRTVRAKVVYTESRCEAAAA